MDARPLAGKRAIVVGGGSGIGPVTTGPQAAAESATRALSPGRRPRWAVSATRPPVSS